MTRDKHKIEVTHLSRLESPRAADQCRVCFIGQCFIIDDNVDTVLIIAQSLLQNNFPSWCVMQQNMHSPVEVIGLAHLARVVEILYILEIAYKIVFQLFDEFVVYVTRVQEVTMQQNVTMLFQNIVRGIEIFTVCYFEVVRGRHWHQVGVGVCITLH